MFRSAKDILSWKRGSDWLQQEKAKAVKEPVLFSCDECSKDGWSSETEAEIHRITKHISFSSFCDIPSEENYCFICIQKYADQEALLKHIKIEHLLSTENATRVEREIYICHECSAIFFNKNNLIYHIRNMHCFKDENFECPLCNESTQTICYQPNHFYVHVKKSVSTCSICLVKCKSTAHLRDHYKDHPYYLKCEMCYFDTKYVELFHSHLKNHHKGEAITEQSYDYKRLFVPMEPTYMKFQKIFGLCGLHLANDVHVCIICREICIGETEMKKHFIKHTDNICEIVLGYICSCGEGFTNKVLFKHHIFKSQHKIDFNTD